MDGFGDGQRTDAEFYSVEGLADELLVGEVIPEDVEEAFVDLGVCDFFE